MKSLVIFVTIALCAGCTTSAKYNIKFGEGNKIGENNKVEGDPMALWALETFGVPILMETLIPAATMGYAVGGLQKAHTDCMRKSGIPRKELEGSKWHSDFAMDAVFESGNFRIKNLKVTPRDKALAHSKIFQKCTAAVPPLLASSGGVKFELNLKKVALKGSLYPCEKVRGKVHKKRGLLNSYTIDWDKGCNAELNVN